MIIIFWSNEKVKAFYKEFSTKIGLDDTIAYFFDKITTISMAGYIPSVDDILKVRIQTNSIIERTFESEGALFKFYDVAGQKDKRFRWVPYLQSSLKAIIYIMSIASFDQKMAEDPTMNRFIDALVLFESLMQSVPLKLVSTIVLFNKADLFQEKCKVIDFAKTIHHYKGKNTAKDILKFISLEFKRKNTDEKRQLITHVTTGTDIKLMKSIIEKIT